MIGTIVRDDPSLLEYYVEVKSAIEGSLTTAVEPAKFSLSNYVLHHCLEFQHKLKEINKSYLNQKVLDVYTRNAEDLPSREPLEYGDYAKGWLASMATDLAILKRVRTSETLLPDYKELAQQLSEKLFDKLARKHSERIAYQCHFPVAEKTGRHQVFEKDTYNVKWALPLRRSWYKNVYKEGIGINDIAGKTVMVISASPLPMSEQPVWEDERIFLYKAKVAYAKTVRKGQVRQTRCRISDLANKLGGVELPSIEYDDFIELNPTFITDYPSLRISKGPVKQAKLQHPRVSVSAGHEHKYQNMAFMLNYNDWQPATKGFIEERYIAKYQNASMKEPKTASGTTPLRAVAVLRGRIIKDVLGEMGMR